MRDCPALTGAPSLSVIDGPSMVNVQDGLAHLGGPPPVGGGSRGPWSFPSDSPLPECGSGAITKAPETPFKGSGAIIKGSA